MILSLVVSKLCGSWLWLAILESCVISSGFCGVKISFASDIVTDTLFSNVSFATAVALDALWELELLFELLLEGSYVRILDIGAKLLYDVLYRTAPILVFGT